MRFINHFRSFLQGTGGGADGVPTHTYQNTNNENGFALFAGLIGTIVLSCAGYVIVIHWGTVHCAFHFARVLSIDFMFI